MTQAGITPAPAPAYGPWRRLAAQSEEAGIRVVPKPGAILFLATGLAPLPLLDRRRKARA